MILKPEYTKEYKMAKHDLERLKKEEKKPKKKTKKKKPSKKR